MYLGGSLGGQRLWRRFLAAVLRRVVRWTGEAAPINPASGIRQIRLGNRINGLGGAGCD